VPAVRLRNASLEAVVVPEAGGGLAAFDWIALGGAVPLMRALPAGTSNPEPNLLACYPLVPWSNRIGHARFEFGGKTWQVAPNYPKEPYPIHGEGWLNRWSTLRRSEEMLVLGLDRREGSPFAYTAQLAYTLDRAALVMELSVVNRGAEPMLYGLGLHPWFERTPQVTLHAPARGMWLGGPDLLPIAHALPPADADFSSPRPLPRRLLDNCFTGWNGTAVIEWKERHVELHIETTPRLTYYVCYCPVGKDLFCFEPVTHPIDAFNLPEPFTRAGLKALAPDEHMSICVTFRAAAKP
jgi:aldose 1-epimerase